MTQRMPVKSDQYEQICVVTITGDFVGESTEKARKLIEESIDQKQLVDFVIDFEKTEFIDSDGLETLLWIKRRCEDMFGQLRLANVAENCRKILEITRLDARFQCLADLPAALKTMR